MFKFVGIFMTFTSQGGVATIRGVVAGILNDCFITRLFLSLRVKEFCKSVNIWRSYGQE